MPVSFLTLFRALLVAQAGFCRPWSWGREPGERRLRVPVGSFGFWANLNSQASFDTRLEEERMTQTQDKQQASGVLESVMDERGIVGWILVLIILGVIFAIWLIVQVLQAIF